MSTPRHLPWQRPQWANVTEARQRGQLHHAWLLSGPQGVGKRSFVRAWAASLLCNQPDGLEACGACAGCKMLAAGGHPDAHFLSLDGHIGLATTPSLQAEEEDGLTFWKPKSTSARKEIAVDAARSLTEKLGFSPNRGGMRVVVVQPADEMSLSTANALLKSIEEPPANTIFIFIAVFPMALPQTIRSRCQQLRFAVPDTASTLAWLKRENPKAEAAHLQAVGGAPLKALAWLRDGTFEVRLRWTQIIEQVLLRKMDALAAAAELARDKTDAGEVLRHWQQVLTAQLRAGQWSARHEQFLAGLMEALRAIENTNANGLLTLESLLLRWRQLAPAAASA